MTALAVSSAWFGAMASGGADSLVTRRLGWAGCSMARWGGPRLLPVDGVQGGDMAGDRRLSGSWFGTRAAVMSALGERRTVSRIAGGCAALDGGGRARRRPAGAVASPASRASSGGRTLAGCAARMAVVGRRGVLLEWAARCNSIFEVSRSVCRHWGLCFGRRRGALTRARIPNAIESSRPEHCTPSESATPPRRRK